MVYLCCDAAWVGEMDAWAMGTEEGKLIRDDKVCRHKNTNFPLYICFPGSGPA